jgi:hypothetical protein
MTTRRFRQALSIAGVFAGFLSCPAFAQPVPAAGAKAAESASAQPIAPVEHVSPSSEGASDAVSEPPSAAPALSPPSGPTAEAPVSQFPVREWEVPAVDVPGVARPALREEERIGTYGQPRWSAFRQFPTTRLYVMPAGRAEAEYWMRYTFPWSSPNSGREVRSYYELGFGLGHRMQLDIYVVTQQEGFGDGSSFELKREQIELRYALADWGKIWGNPTLYLEYQRRSGGHDWIEPKILLGGTIAPGWHAGLNLVMEKELGGPTWEHEYQLTGGISRTLVDQGVHMGWEAYVETHDFSGARFKFGHTERLFLTGPAILLQPIPPMHILLTPLLGAGSGGEEDLRTIVRFWFVAGWTL